MTAPDVSALVAELQRMVASGQHSDYVTPRLREAADALTALQARLEKAEAELGGKDEALVEAQVKAIFLNGRCAAALKLLQEGEREIVVKTLRGAICNLPAASEAAARVIRDAVEWHEAAQHWAHLTVVEENLSQSVTALLKARGEQG